MNNECGLNKSRNGLKRFPRAEEGGCGDCRMEIGHGQPSPWPGGLAFGARMLVEVTSLHLGVVLVCSGVQDACRLADSRQVEALLGKRFVRIVDTVSVDEDCLSALCMP